jgi:hypothetical protein
MAKSPHRYARLLSDAGRRSLFSTFVLLPGIRARFFGPAIRQTAPARAIFLCIAQFLEFAPIAFYFLICAPQ